MYNISTRTLRAFILMYFIVFGINSNAQINGTDTLNATIATNEQWQQSTAVDYNSSQSFPWTGISYFPVDSTYTRFAVLEQPYGYVTISTIPGSSVIKSEDGVRFFRTYFNVDSLATIINCRFRGYVDDDMAIYINGLLVAIETTGTPSNYKGAPHDLMLYNFGPHYNGFNGGDMFDYVTPTQTNTFFKEGENELMVAVRNKKNDLGGFSFRMDYDYVINPEWVGLPEDGVWRKSEVYPNPGNDWVTIQITEDSEESIITLYNASGEKVFEKTENNYPLKLNIQSFPAGIYHLLVSNSKHSYSTKLIRN